jgi:multimeric flavodoxin WrbA
MKVLAILGSRNHEGQTARATGALVSGAKGAGAEVESIFLTELTVERCRQCDANGWGLCRREGRCVIEDDFARVVDGIRAADAVVFGNPVYFGDLSESLKSFLDRLRRITRHEAGKVGLTGKPAVGVCVAGGGGGGAPNCCLLLERTLSTCGFDVLDVVPVRRQNLTMKLEVLGVVGRWLVASRASS